MPPVSDVSPAAAGSGYDETEMPEPEALPAGGPGPTSNPHCDDPAAARRGPTLRVSHCDGRGALPQPEWLWLLGHCQWLSADGHCPTGTLP